MARKSDNNTKNHSGTDDATESGEQIQDTITDIREDPISNNPVTRADDVETEIKHLRRVSRFLDNAIKVPKTKYRFGADSIIGLIPVAGDTLTSVFSVYILYKSYLLGISKATVARMMINIVIDTVVGMLPIVGDLFDAGWKANNRNVELLEKRGNGLGSGKRDKWFAIVFVTSPFILIITLIISFGWVIFGLF